MLKFILRRCLEAIPTLFILITISFFMMRLAPGSPFTGERTLPPEVMANIEAKYHLNDPISTQYFNYLKQLAHGDFGPSFKYKDYSVNDLVASSFPVSAKLGAAAFILAVVLGVTAGVIAALKQNTKWDYTVMGVAMTGVVIPSFVVAPLLVMIFAITLKWLPGGGWNGGALKFMILPMVALSLAYIASIARITRGSMIEVLHSNFIRTARAVSSGECIPFGAALVGGRMSVTTTLTALVRKAAVLLAKSATDARRSLFAGDTISTTATTRLWLSYTFSRRCRAARDDTTTWVWWWPSRMAWSAPSRPGISRWSWCRGRWAPRWRRATRWCSNPPR